MSAPSYDEATLARYLHALDPALYDDAQIGPLLRRLERDDADLLLAVADVDRSQIRDALARSPAEGIAAVEAIAATFRGMRVVRG